MSTPEDTGVSRREMLRRSAVVGGTLLWVTPTVSVLSASPALAGSPTPRGDGSPLRASYYILSIKCGTTYYLVKIDAPGSDDTEPFKITSGPTVHGAANDPNDGYPSDNRSESKGIARRHIYALETAGLPDDVAFYVVDGMLYVDLDVDNSGSFCTLDYWIGHKGTLFYKQGDYAKAYDPQVFDADRPHLLAFPLLKNQNGNT